MQPFPWSNGVISSLLVTRIRNIYLCSQQSLAVSLEEIESLLAIILLHYWTHQTSLLFELQALKTKSSPCSQKFSLVRSNNFIYSSFLLSATRSTCTLLKLTYGAWEKVWTVCMGLLVTSERWRSNLFSTEATSEHLTPQRCACYVAMSCSKKYYRGPDKNWEGSPTAGTTWPCQEWEPHTMSLSRYVFTSFTSCTDLAVCKARRHILEEVFPYTPWTS